MIGKIVQNKYEVIKELGRGGMSVVYLVKDWKINKLWAMKVLNDDVVMSDSEFYLLTELNHFGIPRVVDWFYIDNCVVYIMDYIEGVTLDKLLVTQKQLSQVLVKDIAIQLCDILHYLHTRRPPIIYRDMKPSNIMLLETGQVKLIDLGISRTYKQKQSGDTQILGTRGYCPPEQYGVLQTDERSDVYALGMTLHHLLTGHDPREIDYIYQSPRTINKKISRYFSQIIDRCTQIDIKKRYGSCLKVKKAIVRKITIPYKQMWFSVGIVIIIGVGAYWYYSNQAIIKQRQYDSLIWKQPIDKNGKNYIQAIHLMPHRIEAYTKLLMLLAKNNFNDDKQQLLALYRLYKHHLDDMQDDVQQFYYQIGRQLLAYATLSEHDFYYQLQQANYFLERVGKQSIKSDTVNHYVFFCRLYTLHTPTQVSVDEISKETWQDILNHVDDALRHGDTFDKMLISQLFLNLVFKQKENIKANNMTKSVNHMVNRIKRETPKYVATQTTSKKLQNNIIQMIDSVVQTLE